MLVCFKSLNTFLISFFTQQSHLLTEVGCLACFNFVFDCITMHFIETGSAIQEESFFGLGLLPIPIDHPHPRMPRHTVSWGGNILLHKCVLSILFLTLLSPLLVLHSADVLNGMSYHSGKCLNRNLKDILSAWLLLAGPTHCGMVYSMMPLFILSRPRIEPQHSVVFFQSMHAGCHGPK